KPRPLNYLHTDLLTPSEGPNIPTVTTYEAMSDYIREELAKSFIQPSTSPDPLIVPSISYLVPPPPRGRIFPLSQPESEAMSVYMKKDGGLRPYIDYRGLNEITVRFRYPLPLVPSALEQLRTTKFFTKLDLRSAYNLIQIREGDERKTVFSTWLCPLAWSIVRPFHLTSISFLGYVISHEGVAMDAIKVNVSWGSFYSRKLNSAERNYDVGDRELLAMKAAFEEWRHWLEGAKHPFAVLTDHQNLEYLKTAKRLNPRQARWSLFFSRFDFTVTYWPGSKNAKANALSCQFEENPDPNAPETIIYPSLILSPIQWDIITEIELAYE
ncbi:hypothetical protein M9458_001742, partial [Cirrhinus mrigala]